MSLGLIPKDSAFTNVSVKNSSGGGERGSSGTVVADKATIQDISANTVTVASLTVGKINGVDISSFSAYLTADKSSFTFSTNVDSDSDFTQVFATRYGNITVINFSVEMASNVPFSNIFIVPDGFKPLIPPDIPLFFNCISVQQGGPSHDVKLGVLQGDGQFIIQNGLEVGYLICGTLTYGSPPLLL